VILCCVLAVAGLTQAVPQELTNLPTQQDDQACQYCKQLVDQVLNTNTLHQVLHSIDKYCDYLPGEFGQQCKQLVDQYGEQLINEILSKYNSKVICTDIAHVCSAKTLFVAGGFVPAPEKQGDPCAMCKQAVGQVLNKNTLEQILHKIESLCDKLPGGFAEQCKQVVDQFGEQLINQILATYTPEKVCKDILHVCSFEKDAPKIVPPMLILANRPQALPKKGVGKDQLCDTCTSVAKQILNRETLEALLNRAEQFCDRLPGWVGEQCKQLLESEGHKVIEELLTKYTPEKVCKDIMHFC